MRKHLKLLLTVLLVGVLMYGGDAGKCRAAEVPWSDDNGCTWKFDNETGILTVSGTGTVCKTSEWEEYCSQVETIVIEEGITEIEGWAFSECKKVTSIKLPDELKTIGINAFNGCENLKEIEIPNTVTEIGGWAFSECKKVISIKLPDELKTIGINAFYGCESLGEIKIPDTVTEIGEGAFSGCSKAESITLSNELIAIGDGAFFGCKNLENIKIPNKVTQIGNNAFYGCESLGEIEIPDTVTEIGDDAFAGCSNAISIKLPKNLQTISKYSFSGCSNLKEITLPEKVTKIGDYAFSTCNNLKEIKIPDTVTEIGEGAFSGCSNVDALIFSEEADLEIIGNYAFSTCNNLKEINIPKKVTEIGDYAFIYHNASQIILPMSLQKIGDGAFDVSPYISKDFLIGCSNEYQISYCQGNNYNYVDMSETPIDLNLDQNHGSLSIAEESYVYTGEEIKPEILVTCKFSNGQTEQDIILCEGRDYEVEYSNNTECGTATVKVTGIGIYTGTLTGDFKIYKDITFYTVKLQYNEIVYDGSEKRPSITISDDKGIALKEGTDYDAVYQNNIHPGQATVIITGKGIYKGTTTAAYTIRGISLEPAQVTLDETIFTYDGSEKKPHVTVTLQGKVLTENVDYVVSYQNNILVGTACVVIQGIGDYEGGVQMSYNILPGGDGAPAVYDKDDTLISGDLIYTITDDEELEVEVAGIADKNLKQLVIPGTVDAEGKTYKVTSVGQKAFYRNNKLQSVVIGNNVASIEDYAFYGCKNVKSIKMGKSVEIIGASAFRKCTKLTSIVLPKSIDKLGKNAFYGCKKLKSITINANSVIDISANAVKGISKKAVIKVPKKLVKGYQKKLKGNTGYKKTMKIKKK